MAIQARRGVRTLAKLAGGASLAALALAPAHAQDAAAPAADDAIVVTGIRASLERAADIKREADQVMDVITAEDVGKLPDANVAEALQRVTGVQITRVFGEGQSVSVRGLQQVRVEVDGRTLLGWSARLSPPENDQLGRSSGLDSVPSSLFGRLEVRKSPLASNAEGGVDITRNIALSLQAQNLMPRKSATTEYSNFNTTALNSYALSERRFSVGVRAKF